MAAWTRHLAAALALCCGCGTGWAADEIGRQLFITGAQPACALCHTLKDAGAEGAIGPSLDELKPDAARVAKAVKNGIGQMPAFSSLTDAQIEAIARYVAEAAGR
jgi:cytochrome c6